jgi:predicted DNA-binding transcriptional regulator YafY
MSAPGLERETTLNRRNVRNGRSGPEGEVRHEKGARLLTLARLLASSAEGLTLDEMAQALEVGRRTAERMRDAVREVFPDLEDLDDPPTRRFRIPGGLDGVFQAPTADELAALRGAADVLEAAGAGVRAASLRVLERKILGQARASARRRIAPDIEALVQAETIAVHAGPRPFEDESVLTAIREAIKSLKTMTFLYDGGRTPGREREVVPFGVLFGRSNYLVAADVGESADDARSWRLDRMRRVAVTDRPGAPPAEFSLADFALESFGIYHDAPEDVVLRISPARAEDARAWRFHARQAVETLADGSVEVRFHAGGMRELAWHLFTWGGDAEILAPESLKRAMQEALRVSLARHA